LKKATYKSQLAYREYVRSLVANLKEHLYLQQWKVTLVWEDEQDEEDETVAHIRVNSSYYSAVISMMPWAEELYNQDPPRIVECLTHEMVHILLDPLYDFACDAASPATSPFLQNIHEQATQGIALILLRDLPKSVYEI